MGLLLRSVHGKLGFPFVALDFISFPNVPVQHSTSALSAFHQRGIYLFVTAWKLGSMTITGIDSFQPRLLLFTPTVCNQVLCKCSDTGWPLLQSLGLIRKCFCLQLEFRKVRQNHWHQHWLILSWYWGEKKVRNGASFIMFTLAMQFLPALIASSSSVNITQCVFIWTDATPLTVPLGTWLRD